MKLFLIVALIIALSSAVYADQCAAQLTCQACVATPLCGWCSVPVIYSSGASGPQCAGFSPNTSVPFVCPGIYSTEVCQSGYVCDVTSGTCSKGAPGQGNTLQECESICRHTDHMVYLCNPTTKQCTVVPPGTPNASSLFICEAVCTGKPTPSPGPVAPVYACNMSIWQCYPTTPGHGGSKLVCDQQCQANNTMYVCDPSTSTCMKVPPLTPDAVPLSQCQAMCSASGTPAPIPPAPGPPPEYIGIWRAIEIHNSYNILEWDIMINNTWAIFTKITQSAKTTFAGVPYHVPNSPDLEMWIQIQTGPNAGQTLRTVGDTSGAAGPENTFGTMAMGTPGGGTPSSIIGAMTNGAGQIVLAMTKCIIESPYCVFTMPSSMEAQLQQVMKAARMIKPQEVKVVEEAPKKLGLAADDKCSQYNTACSVCLSHAYCGWCSVPVTYSDGSKGTQCAGFQGNSTAFVCPGHYSTLSCEVGYICQNLQCIQTAPGNGMPQSVCLNVCKPTPPPAPVPKQYVCDLKTHTCSPCTATICPGSMPLDQCNSICPHPHPGPTPALMGVWRGIYIQHEYSVGEVDFVFDPTGVTVYKDGVVYFHAQVLILGSNVILFTIDSGAHNGHTFGGLFQMANQYQGIYTQMTMALSAYDQNFPTDFNTAMYTTGMKEVVLTQCLKAPCTFPRP